MDLSKEEICYLYSLNGQRLFSQSIGPNYKTINVSTLPANLYFLHIGKEVVKLVKTA